MRARGYSLVEVMVVIGITSVLLAIGTLQFNAYLKRYRSEAQTRMIYSQLLKARVNAVCQRRGNRIKMYPTRFEVYSSTQDDKHGAAPVQIQPLEFPVVCNGLGSVENGYLIDFNNKGIAALDRSVCLEQEDGAVAVDSIVIYATRLGIGKRQPGAECDDVNIETR